MKLLTAKEETLVVGGCDSCSHEIDDWFIDNVIAENLSSTLNMMVYYGYSEAKISRYWNKHVEKYNVNPYLYGRIMDYFKTSLIKQGPF